MVADEWELELRARGLLTDGALHGVAFCPSPDPDETRFAASPYYQAGGRWLGWVWSEAYRRWLPSIDSPGAPECATLAECADVVTRRRAP
jgi:hypothetical protein